MLLDPIVAVQNRISPNTQLRREETAVNVGQVLHISHGRPRAAR